ncbi:transporter, putative [Shewanella benthica KT99]|uniref:Transporter, putative n=1 Tax=Shewanella benthica KT99 TaxID=314608 RepID=A9EK71_9GAMM|nr:transporter, putative [Shewanella benthica KT99]
MQSFFIGIGAVIASALPYILTKYFDVANTAPAGEIADSVRYAFYFGGAVLLLAVGWTVISTKEYSPEERGHYELALAIENNELTDKRRRELIDT